jgi:lipopolysaccharide export system permease protein
VFGGILLRMILWEVTKVFVLSLIGITGILLMAGIIAEASQQGLGPAQILEAIPLLVPSTLPYTIPATTLFATCVVYGRLAADNEILAIKSAGINILQVVKPGLILGLVMSAVTMALYYNVIPYTHHLLRAMVFNDAEELMYSLLKKNRTISHAQLPWAMYVNGVQGRKLIDPIFERHNAKGEIDFVARAQEAELKVHMAKRQLEIHMYRGQSWSAKDDQGIFETNIFPIEMPKDFGKDGQRRPRDMTWVELQEKKVEIARDIEVIRAQIALIIAHSQFNQNFQSLPQHIKNLEETIRSRRLQIVAIDVEMLMRPSLSLGCLCFILVGCPVGIWFSRSDYLSSFITCFLPIVFTYYPLVLCGTGMAKEGRFNPILLVWAADIVIGLMGVLLFWRLLKN